MQTICLQIDKKYYIVFKLKIMSNLVQELKAYLARTPRDQKFKEWEALSIFDEIGPGVFDYLDTVSERIPEIEISNRQLNPEFSLDFSFSI